MKVKGGKVGYLGNIPRDKEMAQPPKDNLNLSLCNNEKKKSEGKASRGGRL